MADTAQAFIKGAPLRDPSWFTGPIAWWSNSLTCGGVERQIIASAKGFQARGLPVTLLCRTISPGGGNDFFLEEARACCRDVQGFSLDAVDGEAFARACGMVSSFMTSPAPAFRDSTAAYTAWLLRVRPRLLHLWNADFIEPLLAAVMAGVPRIIIAGQSLSPAQRAPHGFESVDDALAFTVLSNVLRLPRVVMTNNSRAGCRTYEAWLGLPPGSVALTPNVFDLAAWPRPDARRVADLRQSLGIAENAPVLGGLFRFVSIKDPELWVSAALRACAANPGLYAVIGGHGPELAPIRGQIARSPFAGRILFPGPIRDVPAFLTMCRVFLHTAHVEGLPNVLLEAQAFELPVVTTRCGGAADVVEHGKSGFVLDERDESVLADHISFLLTHKGFAQKAGKAGRERVERYFSAERALSLLWQVYADILPEADLPPAGGPPAKAAAPASRLETGELAGPLVSIVLPTYNHLSFLPQAVGSILAQDYGNYELIVVDDGSTDGTGEYLANLASPRVRVLSGPNTRLPTALNRGFALAKGQYVTWTSADNICLPHFVGTLVRALRAFPQAGFASASFARINGQGMVMDQLSGKASLEQVLCSNSGVAAFMYRRDVGQRAGDYDPKLEGAEDWDMWLRILEIAPAVHVPCVLYEYRWHNDSMRVRLSEKVLRASARTAFRALQRLEQRGGVSALYPWIEECEDRELALFHANLVLGSRMIAPDSFLKGSAVKYLAAAHALRPDHPAAMGNYALALAWHGRTGEAQEMFRRGEATAPEQFALLQQACARQRRHCGQYEFHCPTLACPGLEESELMRRAAAAQPVYTPGQTGAENF